MSSRADDSGRRPRFDYTAVGHVTIDMLADGSWRPGGGAFYSGLQAARLGWRTLIITRGVAAEIEQLLAPYARELTLAIEPARETTTLETVAASPVSTQRLLAWAGPIAAPEDLDTAILHLAPVARETAPRWRGRAAFVGVTAQGLVRGWAHEGAQVERRPLEPYELPAGCDAVVVSEEERESAAALERSGALLAVTRGAGPTLVTTPAAESYELDVPAVEHVRDDVGAGDVFAAALFTALHRDAPPREAVAFAHAAAAVRISGEGAAAIGDSAAIEARLRALS